MELHLNAGSEPRCETSDLEYIPIKYALDMAEIEPLTLCTKGQWLRDQQIPCYLRLVTVLGLQKYMSVARLRYADSDVFRKAPVRYVKSAVSNSSKATEEISYKRSHTRIP
jgi:hypothetical protein